MIWDAVRWETFLALSRTPTLLSADMDSPAFPQHHPINQRPRAVEANQISNWQNLGQTSHKSYHDKVIALRKKLAVAEMAASFADRIFYGTSFPISAMGRTPPEIWFNIFGFLKGSVKLHEMMSVCRFWRSILTDTPVSKLFNPIEFTASNRRNEWSILTLERVRKFSALDVVCVFACTDMKVITTIARTLILKRLTLRDWKSCPADVENLGRCLRSFLIRPAVENLVVEGSSWGGPSFVAWTELPRTTANCTNTLDWTAAPSGPTILALLETVTPEVDFTFRWDRLRQYTELHTIRVSNEIPSYHLSRLNNLRVLRLLGVLIPMAPVVTLTLLEELNIMVSWPVEHTLYVHNGLMLAGLKCPQLDVLRVRGRNHALVHNSITDFVRGTPSISTIELGFVRSFPIGDLRALLEAATQLRYLNISISRPGGLLNSDIFSVLSDTSLAPLIRRVSLVGWGDHTDWGRDLEDSSPLEHMCDLRFGMHLRVLDFRPLIQELEEPWTDCWDSWVPAEPNVFSVRFCERIRTLQAKGSEQEEALEEHPGQWTHDDFGKAETVASAPLLHHRIGLIRPTKNTTPFIAIGYGARQSKCEDLVSLTRSISSSSPTPPVSANETARGSGHPPTDLPFSEPHGRVYLFSLVGRSTTFYESKRKTSARPTRLSTLLSHFKNYASVATTVKIEAALPTWVTCIEVANIHCSVIHLREASKF
ncbi:hypothetical protein B0H16DRAFT_1482388 [Mycena metata]|uniref:F-box domain-containing protein n=1 Tax=Mycena metata TaxID=1033252 RepID=A0AAD7GTW4_9AGAR|nr:hypothetical protein B0H16DRAFT_1482388 [Mycena metata]